jgi:hypothetical protein
VKGILRRFAAQNDEKNFMIRKQITLPLFLMTLILASLACTIFVGGPDYSTLPTIPASTADAEALKEQIKKAFEDGAATGTVTFTISESQITSLLVQRLQSDPSLQQSNSKPLITDPQVYLRDGQMKIYGKTQQGLFAANIGILINVGVDDQGKPKIEIASADFGPLAAPSGLNAAIAKMMDEAYTGSIGPAATGLRIETITITDGLMTISGRIK